MPALTSCSAIGVQSMKPRTTRERPQHLLSARSSVLRTALLTFGDICQKHYLSTYAFKRRCDLRSRVCRKSDLLARTAPDMGLVPALERRDIR